MLITIGLALVVLALIGWAVQALRLPGLGLAARARISSPVATDQFPSKETEMATAATKRTEDRKHSEPLRELFLHAIRVELATVTSISKFVVGWAQSADRYAQAVSNELLSRAQGDTESLELVGRLATVSSAHLRDVTALPTEVVSHFNSELARPEEAEPRKRKAARRKAAA
jgi:hypothetical protein